MGGHVEGSPFLVKAYSAARVSVTDISPGVVGRPVSFTINASHAGRQRTLMKNLYYFSLKPSLKPIDTLLVLLQVPETWR